MMEHADLIRTVLDNPDTVIQYRDRSASRWTDTQGNLAIYYMSGWEEHEFRIKPEPKPDDVYYLGLYKSNTGLVSQTWKSRDHVYKALNSYEREAVIKVTKNGETGKLSVELVDEV